MIDNHTHLDLINENLDIIIQRAKSAGVTEFIVPGILGFPKKLNELQKYSEIKICWGIYPKYAEQDNIFEEEFNKFKNSSIKIAAIGECGLDKRFPKLEKQIELFYKQINVAIEYNLPLIIHLVGCWQKAYEILKSSKPLPRFILHSWNGSAEMAKEFVNIGGLISLSASALRNPDKLSKLLKAIPQNKIIFETDSPDQKPDFIDCKYNEPAYLPQIISRIQSHL